MSLVWKKWQEIKTSTVDLHGLYPGDIYDGALAEHCRKAFENGDERITFIHGHGFYRGNHGACGGSNTGVLGLAVRRTLRDDSGLRQWIYHSTLDCSDCGTTSVNLKGRSGPEGVATNGN
jgi:hypothetical protein